MLLKIFKNLRPEDLLETAQVSKFWSRISRDHQLWQKIILTGKRIPLPDENLNSYIYKLIKMAPCLSQFKIDQYTSGKTCTQDVIKTLVENCPKLRHLVLEVEGGVGLDLLEQITTRWNITLETMSIGISSIETGPSNIGMLRNVKKLHFRIESWTGRSRLV